MALSAIAQYGSSVADMHHLDADPDQLHCIIVLSVFLHCTVSSVMFRLGLERKFSRKSRGFDKVPVPYNTEVADWYWSAKALLPRTIPGEMKYVTDSPRPQFCTVAALSSDFREIFRFDPSYGPTIKTFVRFGCWLSCHPTSLWQCCEDHSDYVPCV